MPKIRAKEKAAREAVIGAVRSAIIRGDLLPGQHIVETEIAERVGVSRTPVREALAILHRLGLVDHFPNRGMFVADMEVGDAREVYMLRAELEGVVCALAARHATDEDVSLLKELHFSMVSARDDTESLIENNIAFHRHIHKMSQSPLLVQLIEDLWARSETFRHSGFFQENAAEAAIDDHELTLLAIRLKDEELARLVGGRAIQKRWPGLTRGERNASVSSSATAT